MLRRFCSFGAGNAVVSERFTRYAERFGAWPPQVFEPPSADLGLVIVIPCFNEPALGASLEALRNCSVPGCAVETIVVVNSGEGASLEVLAANERSLAETAAWSRVHDEHGFRTHAIHTRDLPRKSAGVGLARKIGMDEAARRLDSAGRLDAPILCFDADAVSDRNYLVEVEEFFARNRRSPGCSIYFEHPLCGGEPAAVYEAITLYELHLRYYVQALRYAGFPHAFHTIGSSMAVRASAYLEQGGMNKRKAGEDFYFLHKLIPLGRFGEVNSTRVVPSPRASPRVPFGTGRAVGEYLKTGEIWSYPLEAFGDLRALFASATDPDKLFLAAERLPRPVKEFLAQQEFDAALQEIRANTTTPETFRNRFFRWFDGFRAMKFVHFARDRFYGPARVVDAASSLRLQSGLPTANEDAASLLREYRALQRAGC